MVLLPVSSLASHPSKVLNEVWVLHLQCLVQHLLAREVPTGHQPVELPHLFVVGLLGGDFLVLLVTQDSPVQHVQDPFHGAGPLDQLLPVQFNEMRLQGDGWLGFYQSSRKRTGL